MYEVWIRCEGKRWEFYSSADTKREAFDDEDEAMDTVPFITETAIVPKGTRRPQ